MATSKKCSWSLLFITLSAFYIFSSQGPAYGGDVKSYSAGHFMLELDGVAAGFLPHVEGGNVVAEVVSEKLGPGNLVKKRLGLVKFEDITLQTGANMSKVFYQWVKDTIEQRYVRKNGAIVLTDYNQKEMSRVEFFNGLITEVIFPAADAASKIPVFLQVKITPEMIRSNRFYSGKTYSQPMQKQKNWLASNYRFNINGLEAATARTSKISAPTIKIKMGGDVVGEQRVKVAVPAGVEISNLTAWVSAASSEPLYRWFEDFVLKGNNADNMERTGILEYLNPSDPSQKEVLFRLTFDHLGIFKLSRDMSGVPSGGVAHDKAEMYMENMRFDYAATW